MDPDAQLARIRELYMIRYPSEEDMVELAQCVQDFDEWLSRDGYLPKPWQAGMVRFFDAIEDAVLTGDVDRVMDVIIATREKAGV